VDGAILGEELVALARLSTTGVLRITDASYGEPAEELYIGQKIYLRLDDPDQDRGPERDEVAVVVRTESGEEETVMLVETLSHSGVFTGAFDLGYAAEPVAGNLSVERPVIEARFGDVLSAHYLDATPYGDEAQVVRSAEIGVAHGADGRALAFSKLFGDEGLAIETQFHIAESHFELFKSHRALERDDDAKEALESGRRILRELEEDYPDPRYAPRVAYLLGQFSQELEDWESAIESYERIVRDYDSHSLAPDAQYKLGQCYEQAERFDEAVEAYVTLAATYPDNPLIASVMIRITDYFYRTEEFANAASVGERFLARFEDHPHAPQLAFRVGQCYYKDETFGMAGQSFDRFVKSYPDDELASQALFWSGESYRMANNVAEAFRRYNRCRWDFPESDAAKYARGRLALPEMLTQFEREATSIENDN